MATPEVPVPGLPFGGVIRENLQELKTSWFWFVLLGVALVVLGFSLLSYTGMFWATIVTTVVFGIFSIIAGGFYIAGAFFTRGWGGFFLGLLAGILYVVVGGMMVNHPEKMATVYTLFLAVLFFVEGIFRIIAALAGRFRHWGLMLLSGIITLLLGISIWREWPYSGMFVIGLFLAINLIMNGASYIALGLTARRLPV